jgi:hypothetical protein
VVPSDSSHPSTRKFRNQVQSHIQSLSSEDEETRQQAIRHLGQLGPEAASALPYLRAALSDFNFVVRLEAAIAIGFIGTHEDFKYLLPLLDDPAEAVRFQTISALAFLKDTRTTPELLRRYDTETMSVKDQILRALGHLGGPEAFRLLERELQADNPTVRVGAVVGLSVLGDSRACPLLREVAETDSDEMVAHEAKIALLQIEETCALDAKKELS